VLHQPSGLKAKRLVLAGGGERDKFDAAALRKPSDRWCVPLSRRVSKPWPGRSMARRQERRGEVAVEGAILGNL